MAGHAKLCSKAPWLVAAYTEETPTAITSKEGKENRPREKNLVTRHVTNGKVNGKKREEKFAIGGFLFTRI